MTDNKAGANADDAALRKEARRRLKAKSDWRTLLVTFSVMTVVLIGIWYFTSGPGSYFWPGWAILGFSLALVFTGLEAFGVTRRHITEADVDAEIRKMNGPSA